MTRALVRTFPYVHGSTLVVVFNLAEISGNFNNARDFDICLTIHVVYVDQRPLVNHRYR